MTRWASRLTVVCALGWAMACHLPKEGLKERQPSEASSRTVTSERDDASRSASVVIPSGTLATDVDVVIEEGAAVANDVSGDYLGIPVGIIEAGPSINLDTNVAVADDQINALILSIPLNEETAARLAAGENLVVIYQVRTFDGTFKYGLIPTRELTVSTTHVTFKAIGVGNYQAAYLPESRTEAVAVAVDIPVLKKQAEAALPVIEWTEPRLTFLSTEREMKLSASLRNASLVLKSCIAYLDADRTQPWDYAEPAGATTERPIALAGRAASDLYGKFRCVDQYGRPTESPWSNGEHELYDPKNLSVARTSSTKLTVSWQRPADGVSHYVVAYREGDVAPVDCSGDHATIKAVDQAGPEVSVVVSALFVNRTYGFRVCERGNASSSAGVVASARTLATHMLLAIDGLLTSRFSGILRFPLTKGSAFTTIVDDSTTLFGRRGILTRPGEMICANSGLLAPFQSFKNDGSAGSAILPGEGTVNQPLTRLSGGFVMVPQYNDSEVLVFKEDTGEIITRFGAGKIDSPFRAVEVRDDRILVQNQGAPKISEFRRSGSKITWVKDYTITGLDQGGGFDYCEKEDAIFLVDVSNPKLFRCDATTMNCSEHTLPGDFAAFKVALRMDPNADDCSFFLAYDYSNMKLAKIKGDGTVIDLDWIGVPAPGSLIYDIDFEMP